MASAYGGYRPSIYLETKLDETLRQKEAFEHYYSLGATKSLEQTATHIGVNIRTVKDWSSKFNWQGRKNHRDLMNEGPLERQTNRTVVDTKAEIRKDIEDAIFLMRSTIRQTSNKVADYLDNPSEKGNPLEVANVKDFRELIATYRVLVDIYNDTIGVTNESLAVTLLLKDFEKLRIEDRIGFFTRGSKDDTESFSEGADS